MKNKNITSIRIIFRCPKDLAATQAQSVICDFLNNHPNTPLHMIVIGRWENTCEAYKNAFGS